MVEFLSLEVFPYKSFSMTKVSFDESACISLCVSKQILNTLETKNEGRIYHELGASKTYPIWMMMVQNIANPISNKEINNKVHGFSRFSTHPKCANFSCLLESLTLRLGSQIFWLFERKKKTWTGHPC
jgi:hypothetical protein